MNILPGCLRKNEDPLLIGEPMAAFLALMQTLVSYNIFERWMSLSLTTIKSLPSTWFLPVLTLTKGLLFS